MSSTTIECRGCGFGIHRAAHERSRAPGCDLYGICGRCVDAARRRVRDVYREAVTDASTAYAVSDGTDYRRAPREVRPSMERRHTCMACGASHRMTAGRRSSIVGLCCRCLGRARAVARYHAGRTPTDAQVLTCAARREGVIRGVSAAALLAEWMDGGVMRESALRRRRAAARARGVE